MYYTCITETFIEEFLENLQELFHVVVTDFRLHSVGFNVEIECLVEFLMIEFLGVFSGVFIAHSLGCVEMYSF